MSELTNAERAIMLEPCKCGHTINDHGSLVCCWLCEETNDSECAATFEDLLCQRAGRIVTERADDNSIGGIMRRRLDRASAPPTAPLTPEQPPADHGDGSGAGGREGGEGA